MAVGVFSRRIRLALATVAALCLVGCNVELGSEVHLIPDGYAGPVVILFDDPLGDEAPRDGDGAVVYQIPDGGVLRVKNLPPRAGFYRKQFYYVAADGTRRELPHRVDEEVLQVFDDVQGVTEILDGQPTGSMRWAAYVVGLPSSRSDWAQVRDEAAKQAVRGVTQEHPRRQSSRRI